MTEEIRKNLNYLLANLSEEEYTSFVEQSGAMQIFDVAMEYDNAEKYLTDELLEEVSQIVKEKLSTITD